MRSQGKYSLAVDYTSAANRYCAIQHTYDANIRAEEFTVRQADRDP
jgi:hypothetical protein